MIDSHEEILSQIRQSCLMPAVRVDKISDVLRSLEALLAGGVTVAEIAMSTPVAVKLLDAALEHFGDRMLIGAGTVLDSETARTTILSGAKFIVTPAFNAATISICRRYSIPCLSGALTSTEILAAWSAGADCIKIFPVSSLGGAAYLRALRAPFPQIQMMPMGGVTVDTAKDYLDAGAMALGVGSDLVNSRDLLEGSYGNITRRAQEFCVCIAEWKSAHSE
jgi:2-dehydro-3-deoxyphosphogluconate aldolase/(4S)-4-hydroxy-2-oxoglutarate aldolase